MKYLTLLFLLACGQKQPKPTNYKKGEPANDTTAPLVMLVGEGKQYLIQGDDTITFPLAKEYKEYIFWWTITTDNEHTWNYSLLYSKTWPTKDRLIKEATRVTDYVGPRNSDIKLRDVIAVDPSDTTRWDGVIEKWKIKFRTELAKH